jgi:hypothetical protein
MESRWFRSARYCLVSVSGPVGKGGRHVLLLMFGVPDIVETAAIVTAMVPVIWPAQDGCSGIPPGPTEIKYVSVVPLTEPVRKPFINTAPVGRDSRTGPLTDVPVCESVHVIPAEMPSAETLPAHVPATFVTCGVGVDGVWSLLPHAGISATPQQSTIEAKRFRIKNQCTSCEIRTLARFNPFMLLSILEEAE